MKKSKYTYKLNAKSNRYGFGRDWTLILSDGKRTKSFWLGQAPKVTARTMGMDYDYAVDYYTKKANSKNWDKVAPYIARDLIKIYLGKSISDSFAPTDIKKILDNAEDWSLAVE